MTGAAPVLDRMERLPDGLATLAPRDIRRAFPNPTLISLDGRRGAPLFVSVMLHGNETTGFKVLQNLARRFETAPPIRPLMIFVGNVAAAEIGARALPGGADYNRIWAGGDAPECALAAEVVAAAKSAGIFASIDIHNNTGANPVYGCVNTLDPQHLELASLFSRICVYYTNPKTTQSIAFTPICPAVTVECGKPGEPEGVARATQFVLDTMHLERFEPASRAGRDLAVYHTVGRIVVDPSTSFAFAPARAPLVFPADLETLNFSPLPRGRAIARARTDTIPLSVRDEDGADITGRFLEFDGDEIRLSRPATPSMFTHAAEIIRQDCLGYLMEELRLEC